MKQGDSNGSTGTTFPVYCKYKLNGVLYQKWKNSRNIRNSSVCKCTTINGASASESIHCFCLFDKLPVAVIAIFLKILKMPL